MTTATKPPPAPPKLPVVPQLPSGRRYRTTTVLTHEQLDEVVAAYSEFEEFVFDVETTGPYRGDPRRNDVFWLSLAGPGRSDVIPMGHPTGDLVEVEIPMRKDGKGPLKNAKPILHHGRAPKQLYPGEVFEALRPLFFGPARKIGHNVKFDLESIAKYYDNVIPPGPYGDTIIAAHLENENHRGNRPYGLDSCVKRVFGFMYPDKSMRMTLEEHAYSRAAAYSITDAKYTWLLWNHLWALLELDGLIDLLELEMDVLDVVVHMEHTGAPINVEMIRDVDEALQEEIAALYERVRAAAGWDINLNANAQVAKLVYEVRKHKPRMFTDKTHAPSTSEKALEIYREKDPVVDAVLEHANLNKVHGTFVVGIRERLVNERVHATFDQRGTVTGRFSSSNPNLQNIPVRNDRMRELIRGLFWAPPGWRMIVADYSQIELRVLAHYSKDPLLMQAYTEGLDLHTLTAQRGYHTQTPTTEQRARAKNVNFSMVFGAGPQTLVEKYGIPTEREARALMDAFFSTYRRVRPWRDNVIRICRRSGISVEQAKVRGCRPRPPYVETILGRKRRLPEIRFPDQGVRAAAERRAINTIIQGSAADINKLALTRLHVSFRDRPMHMILTVHDEIVSLVREEVVDEGVALVTSAMEGVGELVGLRVPLTADVKVVDDWSKAKG